MEQLSGEEAIAFYHSEKWKNMTAVEKFVFQINQQKLCMPFEEFHKATEEALGRSVWTHEFARPQTLRDEFDGKVEKPDINEIMMKLVRIAGKDKVVIVSK